MTSSTAPQETANHEWMKKTSVAGRHLIATRIAYEMQRADTSDPFVGKRVYSQLMNGGSNPTDYGRSF